MAQTNINRVTITGNVGRDAELKATTSGLAVLTFSVACNERRKSGNEWTEYTNWFDVVLYGRRAEALSDYIRKGQRVAIDGKLSYRSWETRDGRKATRVEIKADEVELLGSQGASAPTQRRTAPVAAPAEVYDEDIPF